jgi:hypothetical protein
MLDPKTDNKDRENHSPFPFQVPFWTIRI